MNVAVILAGGEGHRVGARVPKQFIDVLGHPVISYTIKRFENHNEIDGIEVVIRKGYRSYLENLIRDEGFKKVKWIVEGGETFQESVINGIRNLAEDLSDDDQVLVHYGASPFVTRQIISDAIRVCNQHGNSCPASSLVYLAGNNEDGRCATTFLDRDAIMCLNSPHVLNYGYAKWIYDEAERREILDKVDPHTTSLMFELGEPVFFSMDSSSNIKITTADDLLLFKGWLLVDSASHNPFSDA